MQEVVTADLEQSDPGTHLCAFYRSAEELDGVARTFVRAALAAGDRVLYVASVRSPSVVVEALQSRGIDAAGGIASGQLIVESFDDVYGRAGGLDFGELATGFRAAGRLARSEGFPALRVAAEMGEFAELAGGIERLLEWEGIATTLQAEEGITSVCQYDFNGLSEEEVSLVQGQHAGLSPLDASAPLANFVLTRDPAGMRIVGEVDISNRGGFERALAVCADGRANFTIDVAGLAFADVGFLELIFGVARDLPSDGSIRLKNASERLRRLVAITGFQDPRVVLDA